MSAKVVAVLIDAMRHDYLNAEDTPFLMSMSQIGDRLRLKSILGYSDSVRASIFTGTYPDTHGYWMSYRHARNHSPLYIFKALLPLDYLPSDLLRRGIKFTLSATICKALASMRGYESLHLHNIPFSVIDQFESTLSKSMLDQNPFPGCPTVFDVLQKNGVKYDYLDSSVLRNRLVKSISKISSDTEFVMIYLHYIDEASHWFGLNSLEFKNALRYVDSLVERSVKTLSRIWGTNPTLLIFSDHGMIEEQRRVDLTSLLRHRGFGKRFLLALDATMVRVWYFDDKVKASLRSTILGVGRCKRLTAEDKISLRINFKSNDEYGEDIFLFEPGQIIFPNFYSYVRPRAMHAYDPNHSSQLGVFIIKEPRKLGSIAKQPVHVVDILPTILAQFNIRVPESCEGRAILA